MKSRPAQIVCQCCVSYAAFLKKIHILFKCCLKYWLFPSAAMHVTVISVDTSPFEVVYA